MKKKILYIGGNGNISWWCVNKSVALGDDVYVITRSPDKKTRRSLPTTVKIIQIDDINNLKILESKLEGLRFDVVCDFICYKKSDMLNRYKFFKGKIKQYIFISSVVVYQRASKYLPFREDTPQWDITSYDYASDKIEVEQFLESLKDQDFNYTIVRPAHTYDTIVPVPLGHNCFTAPKRYLDGKPLLIAGDGTNLWSTLHSADFADAFCGLVGNESAYGEDFHIAGEEWLNWLEIGNYLMNALGIKKYKTIHVPIQQILGLNLKASTHMKIAYLGDNFRGQRMWCDIYSNEKIRKLIPQWSQKISLEKGLQQTINWLMEDPRRIRVNQNLDAVLEELTVKNIKNSY